MQDKGLHRFGGFFGASSQELCNKWVKFTRCYRASWSIQLNGILSMWVFSLLPFLQWWSVVIPVVAVRVGTDRVMHAVWGAELCFLEHARVSALWVFSNLHCTGSVGSPGVTSIKFVSSYLDRCCCLSFETLHLKLCSTLVTVLPLEVWNTEKFSWEEISTSVFFLLPEQRKMGHFVIKRENSPFFHIDKQGLIVFQTLSFGIL